MQRRSSAAVAPLSALPIPRTREMSALLSTGSAPHTPTKRAEPLPLFSVNPNRYSTDSWNSSNFDGVDEIECDWKPEQIRFLGRTLDNLPAHLLTPFIGSVLPSNLLDKIARRVSEAKGNEWPHSLRATRAKIVELGRLRAKDVRDESASDTIAEEGSGSDVPLQQTTNIGVKRPLYRQSSMDFMQAAKTDVKDNANISRLSRRLQKTDRILTSPSYKSYARSPSPPRGLPSIHPSTPSSTTLNSSISSTRGGDRNSVSSTLSSVSDQPGAMAVRRVRRSDTFAGSSLFSKGLKRAPSFGSSRNSLDSVAMSIDFDAKNSDATSSDEEERLRVRKAKRARRKVSSPAPASGLATAAAPPSSYKPISRVNTATTTSSSSSKRKKTSNSPAPAAQPSANRPKLSLQRNPSILGGELPAPQPNVEPPAVARANQKARRISQDVSMLPPNSPAVHSPVLSSAYNLTHIPPMTPHSQSSGKVLRRSRPTAPLPRASLARKISFGSLASAQEEASGASGFGLGSAFQLH